MCAKTAKTSQFVGVGPKRPTAACHRHLAGCDPSDFAPAVQSGDRHAQPACQLAQPPFVRLQVAAAGDGARAGSRTPTAFAQKATEHRAGELCSALRRMKAFAVEPAGSVCGGW